MSPLLKGPNTIRNNVSELMNPVQNKARHRAILTIAKINNISYKEAQFRQASRIAQSQARRP